MRELGMEIVEKTGILSMKISLSGRGIIHD